MLDRLHLILIKLNLGKKHSNPARTIMLAFALIIIIGTGLLLLPAASLGGTSCGLLTALFTSTSATCVAGLVIVDTYEYWSTFGHIVILTLVQIGGIGFMTALSLISFLVGRRISYRERLVIAHSMSLTELSGVVRLVKNVIIWTISAEFVGAVVLSICFIPKFGVSGGIVRGIFHSISAFCNAGFDIMGNYSSMTAYTTNPVVNITITVLVMAGGLGFYVWQDIFKKRNLKKLSVYSKLVLIASAILFVLGFVFYLIAEHDNPATYGPLTWPQKMLAALFQSGASKTSGFVTIDQTAMTDASKVMSMLLMSIGGCSGSTAGGLKVGTIVVLLLGLVSVVRARKDVVAFRRSISVEQVLNAMTIVAAYFILVIAASLGISLTQGFDFMDSVFETVSALATVGVTSGILPYISSGTKILYIIFMFLGRVGILTISVTFLIKQKAYGKLRYAETRMLIG